MNNNRILGFDFLRGLCAIGIAVYHVLGWQEMHHIKLYSIALYGVYIFFVLSGASIYIAYADKIRAGYDLRKFMGLRLFRLVPLFALVVLIGPLVDYGNFSRYDAAFFGRALLNVSFAFGVGNPGQASLATGGWSLGIEFVFYLLFPVILAFISGGWRSSIAFLVLIGLCQFLFVRTQIAGNGDLGNNFYTYIEFLAFPFYFVAGCLIGRIIQASNAATDSVRWQATLWTAFAVLAAAILLSNGDFREAPLLENRRILLPLACVALVLVSGYLRFPSGSALIAVAFGNMSYGMYLLHPLVYTAVKGQLPTLLIAHPLRLTALLVVFTALLALVIERYFERPINQLGKRLLNRKAVSAGPFALTGLLRSGNPASNPPSRTASAP